MTKQAKKEILKKSIADGQGGSGGWGDALMEGINNVVGGKTTGEAIGALLSGKQGPSLGSVAGDLSKPAQLIYGGEALGALSKLGNLRRGAEALKPLASTGLFGKTAKPVVSAVESASSKVPLKNIIKNTIQTVKDRNARNIGIKATGDFINGQIQKQWKGIAKGIKSFKPIE